MSVKGLQWERKKAHEARCALVGSGHKKTHAKKAVRENRSPSDFGRYDQLRLDLHQSPQAASRKPQAASRKPQAASRKPQAASRIDGRESATGL